VTPFDRFRLDGQTAVVTGGLGRLGPVWAGALVAAGARVAAVDLPGATPSASFQRLRTEHADRVTVVDADVTSRDSLERARPEIEAAFGPVGILVNNAGIDTPPGDVARTFTIPDHDAAVFLRTLEVNVLGAFMCAQVFGEGMVARRRGSIINIGSLYAS